MKRGKRRVSLFDAAYQDARFRRRQDDNATMFISDPVLLDCFDIVSHMMTLDEAEPFNDPVDWRALGLGSYPVLIKNPMDLGTVKELLIETSLDSHDKFAEYVRLVFSNAMTFNLAESPIWVSAKHLLEEFERLYEELQARHKVGKFVSFDHSGYAVQSPVASAPLTASGSTKRQKVRHQPHTPTSPLPQQSMYLSGDGYDDEGEIAQMEEQIRGLQDSIKRVTELINQEKYNQERAAEEARNRPPKRVRLSKPIQPVTFEDRQQLVYKIPELDQADLPELLDIVRLSLGDDGDEIEIDIENMDDRTFRKVQDFVFRRIQSRQQLGEQAAVAADPLAATPAPVASSSSSTQDVVMTDQPAESSSSIAASEAPTQGSENETARVVDDSSAMDVDPAPTAVGKMDIDAAPAAATEMDVDTAASASPTPAEQGASSIAEPPEHEAVPEQPHAADVPEQVQPAEFAEQATEPTSAPPSETLAPTEAAGSLDDFATATAHVEPTAVAEPPHFVDHDTRPGSQTPSEHSEAGDGMDVDQAPANHVEPELSAVVSETVATEPRTPEEPDVEEQKPAPAVEPPADAMDVS